MQSKYFFNSVQSDQRLAIFEGASRLLSEFHVAPGDRFQVEFGDGQRIAHEDGLVELSEADYHARADGPLPLREPADPRVEGMPAQAGTPTTDADPGNPNVPAPTSIAPVPPSQPATDQTAQASPPTSASSSDDAGASSDSVPAVAAGPAGGSSEPPEGATPAA